MDYVTLSNIYSAAARPDDSAHRRITELERRVSLGLAARDRRLAIALRREGWTIRSIADLLEATEYRVRKWTKGD